MTASHIPAGPRSEASGSLAGPHARVDDPPRVVMVVKRAAGPGGMQRQARRVTLQLIQDGVPVALVCHRRGQRGSRTPWGGEVPTTSLAAPDRWTFAAALYRHLLHTSSAYDVVHVHGLDLEVLGALAACRRTGRALVVKPSTAGPGTKLHVYADWTARLRWTSAWWREIDAWVSISTQVSEDLPRLGVSPQRIFSIPNGVDTSLFHPLTPDERRAARASVGLDPEAPVLCTVARLTPHKRVDLLLRAFMRLHPDFPDARLWIMGTGEQEAELRRQAAEADGAVEILGQVDSGEVARRMQLADVFALVSRWEGLSNALLEAMACGLAPVVTDVSGTREVVEHGTSGIVVSADDEEMIYESLRQLVADRKRAQQLGAAAARTVAERYSLRQTSHALVQLYRESMARTRGRTR
jgi:glycosyltransferase involved in cell wall biosynthesis